MKQYKKTLIGGFIALVVGTSCCWLSSLAIALGGATIIGTTINMIENYQIQLIALSVLFVAAFLYVYKRNKKAKLP